jgi:hypothetical protein
MKRLDTFRVLALLALLALSPNLQAQDENKKPSGAAGASADQASLGKLRFDLNSMRGDVNKILISGDVSDQAKTTLQKHIGLRLDIIKSPAAMNDLPAERDIIKRELRRIGAAADQEKKGLAYMNQTYLPLLEEIVFDQPENKYPPAVRYNCMLLIGDLNSRELSLTGAGTAVPMPEAVPILLRGLTDANTSDAVKIAALVGLKRNAELGIADKTFEKQVVMDVVKLVEAKTPPGSRTDEAHQLFRRRAIELLGTIGRAGYTQTSNEVVSLLTTVVSDASEPLEVRSDAARALGRFQFAAPGPSTDVMIALGNLAVEATKLETTKVGYKHYLRSALLALNGPEGQPADQPKRGMVHNLAGEQKKFADELVKQLNDLWSAAEARNVTEFQLPQKMKTAGEKLEDFLKQKPTVAAAGG